MNEQPEALRIADLCSNEILATVQRDILMHEAAAELRRLHAEVERLRANQQPSVPEGWKLVPVQPTVEMMDAGGAATRRCYQHLNKGEVMCSYVYRHMLAAAPQPASVELEPLSDYVIQELADDGVFRANVFEIVRRIEEKHGIFKLR